MMNLKLHSVEDVAGLLGIEADTVYRYARKGQIRGMKVGKAWRFLESDVRDFLENRRHLVSPPTDAAILLPDILTNAARDTAGQGCVLWRGETASYAEIDAMAARLATSLLANGILPGDRVVLLLPTSLEFIAGCFGVWKTGAILVPGDSTIRSDNLRHILKDCSPKALIIDRGVADQLEGLGDALASVKVIFIKDRTFALSGLNQQVVESLDEVLEQEVENRILRLPGGQPDDIVSISYTSGTTGLPKGVVHTHRSWLAGACFTRDYHRLTPKDTIVVPLPLSHGLAFRQLLAFILTGARILLTTDIYQALKLIREQRPTAAVLVPAAINILIDHFAPVLEEVAPFLRYLEIGSAALAPERYQELRRLLPATAIHLPYGLTEARVGFLKAGPDGLLNRIAKIDPSLELQVVDENAQPVAPGKVGEIRLRGAGLMKGYWGQTEADWQRLKRDGFRSGDMGTVDEKGEVALLGRLDDMLKVGGRKVSPTEVENVLKRHPAVAECAVIGAADPRGLFETRLHAFLVPRNKGAILNEKELDGHCRKHLESYKVPARFHSRNSLPKSPVGKVLRHVLATTETDTVLSNQDASPPVEGAQVNENKQQTAT